MISSSDVYEGNTIDADDKKFIVQLAGIIEENMTDENLSLNFLCDKMCVSRMSLYRKIREITQMTPSEYIPLGEDQPCDAPAPDDQYDHPRKSCSARVSTTSPTFYREFAKIYHMSSQGDARKRALSGQKCRFPA